MLGTEQEKWSVNGEEMGVTEAKYVGLDVSLVTRREEIEDG